MSGTYPTEEQLDVIREWKYSDDMRPLFDYMHDLWSYEEWGWREKQGRDEKWSNGENRVMIYSISTGGWSGNEDIIQALRQNKNFIWSIVWHVSRAGGHYVFRAKYPMEKKQ